MATPVFMPKFGMTQENATVIRWLRREGEAVEQGDPLLEVETDKALMEVEAPAGGVLAGLRAQVGEVVPVATRIAYIVAAGEALPAEGAEAHELPLPADRRAGLPNPPGPLPADSRAGLPNPPAPLPTDRTAGPPNPPILLPAERTAGLPNPPGPLPPGEREERRRRATPAARRLAREAGVELAALAGSGPRGRVQAVDVRAAVAAAPRGVQPPGGRLSGEQLAPTLTLTAEANVSAVEALRARVNVDAREGKPAVSVAAVVVKVCAWALLRHHAVGAWLPGEGASSQAEAGVAVAVAGGAAVPVIRGAVGLGLRDIAARLEEMRERARNAALTADDLSGGTFMIVELGARGLRHLSPAVRPPWVAALVVGAVEERAVPLAGAGGTEVAIRPTLPLTLTADSRAVSEAEAVAFLADVVRALEAPGILL